MSIPDIRDLREPPVIGRYYWVPTIFYKYQNMLDNWPVFGPMHHDVEIGFTQLHYHVDPRFLTKMQQERAMFWGWKNYPEYNGRPISEPRSLDGQIVPEFGEIPRKPTLLKRRCSSLDFQWHPPYKPGPNSPLWEKPRLIEPALAIVRKDGRLLCPHKKVDLSQFAPDKDGIVTCPVHGLKVRCRPAEACA